MATVSSAAMLLGMNKGKLVIEWFGWEFTTTTSFFIILLITTSFVLYILITFTIKVLRLPSLIKKKIIKYRLKKAQNALYNGIIASSYGNKIEVNKNLILAKKTLRKSPLLLFLELQNSILKKNDKNSFFVLSNMLSDPILKPLAIKGLIAYAKKNNDIELFSNMLHSSLDKKVNISWVIQDALNFCIENNHWKYLSTFIEKKISRKSKKYNHILSLVNFKIANGLYLSNDDKNANFYLEKALSINKYFPAFIELYCKLYKTKDKAQLLRVLKKYWKNYPHPNIENCINIGLEGLDELSKIQELSKILIEHDNLHYKHLVLGKLKYKAKIWGESKKDLKKSIKLKPTKAAYYYLYQMEKKFSNDSINIAKWKNLFNQSNEVPIFECSHCKTKLMKWDIFCHNCNKFDSIILSMVDINKKILSNKQSNYLLDSLNVN